MSAGVLDFLPVHPGSLRSLHPQYGSGSHRRPPTGHRHGAAGLLQPRLVDLHRLVLAWSRLHHSGPLRHGRSGGVFGWEQLFVVFTLFCSPWLVLMLVMVTIFVITHLLLRFQIETRCIFPIALFSFVEGGRFFFPFKLCFLFFFFFIPLPFVYLFIY